MSNDVLASAEWHPNIKVVLKKNKTKFLNNKSLSSVQEDTAGMILPDTHFETFSCFWAHTPHGHM